MFFKANPNLSVHERFCASPTSNSGHRGRDPTSGLVQLSSSTPLGYRSRSVCIINMPVNQPHHNVTSSLRLCEEKLREHSKHAHTVTFSVYMNVLLRNVTVVCKQRKRKLVHCACDIPFSNNQLEKRQCPRATFRSQENRLSVVLSHLVRLS